MDAVGQARVSGAGRRPSPSHTLIGHCSSVAWRLPRQANRATIGVISDEVIGFEHSRVSVRGASIHAVTAGQPLADPFLFLHGWPETWQSWQPLMALAARLVRAIAIDLPGVGSSQGNPTDGSKWQLGALVHQLIEVMGLERVTLVGQDVGGMIAYAYLRQFDDLARDGLMDTAIPGVTPWKEVRRNPYRRLRPGIDRVGSPGRQPGSCARSRPLAPEVSGVVRGGHASFLTGWRGGGVVGLTEGRQCRVHQLQIRAITALTTGSNSTLFSRLGHPLGPGNSVGALSRKTRRFSARRSGASSRSRRLPT